MRKSMFWGLGLIASVMISACDGTGKKTESTENEQTEQVEVVAQEKTWVGTYEGLIPSASGSGIQVVLVLNENDTYVKTDTYADETDVFEDKGVIEWGEDGVRFALVNEAGEKSFYLLSEEGLVVLTADGTPVEGELASVYILRKK